MDEDEVQDLTLPNLDTVDAIFELGRQTASMLKSFGSASFLVDEQGAVRLVNPLLVFFDHRASNVPETEPVFVRPILTNGRPQFVAKKPDGSLWEVEYPNELATDSEESEEGNTDD